MACTICQLRLRTRHNMVKQQVALAGLTLAGCSESQKVVQWKVPAMQIVHEAITGAPSIKMRDMQFWERSRMGSCRLFFIQN